MICCIFDEESVDKWYEVALGSQSACNSGFTLMTIQMVSRVMASTLSVNVVAMERRPVMMASRCGCSIETLSLSFRKLQNLNEWGWEKK